MDITYFYNPIITPGIIAAAGSLAILAGLFWKRAVLLATLNQAREKIFTRSGFFWTVNIVFMAVSVLHAGVFFGITGNGSTTITATIKGKQVSIIVPGHSGPNMTQYLGFAVSFFLDLVTIILMQAMLESRYRGEDGRARQFLFFIAVCCGTSTFANMAISLNDYDPSMLPHAPFWVQVAAPYVLASFPLFVIMMSIAAEMIVNLRPLEKLQEEEYEADEKKRVRIMQIRNTYLEKQAQEEVRALMVRAQIKANRHLRKGNITFHWPWQKVDTELIIAGVTTQLKAMYEPQIEALKKQLEQANTSAQNAANTTGIPDVLASQNGANSTSESTTNKAEKPGENVEQNDTNSASVPPVKTDEKANENTNANGIDSELISVTENYPRVASEWLASNRKTATFEEIIEVTGQPKRRLNKANFRRSSRNPELVVLSSVIEWLKTAPKPTKNEHQTEDLSGESERVKSLLKSALNPRYSESNPALSTATNGQNNQPKVTVNLNEFPEILV